MRMGWTAALLALAVGGCVVEQPAPPGPRVVVAEPPPIPVERVEVIPAPPSPRHIWQPGGWHWDGRAYVWIPGRYVIRVANWHRWERGHWERGYWVPGHWV